MALAIETGQYKQISASANCCPVNGALLGIFVSAAASTPTITIYDSATTGTGTPIVSVFTPVAATFYRIPVNFTAGCYVVISGTVSCTVITAPFAVA